MYNKLGINECKFKSIERKIINTKLNLLDEYFTFNKDEMNFEYLKSINDFLFSDMYYKDDIGTRLLTDEEVVLINKYLDKINNLSIKLENKKEILKLIKEVWYLQPFKIGNTRTMMAYLKILDKAYFLNLGVDVNIKIENNPSIFDLNNTVNQKRLTKNK